MTFPWESRTVLDAREASGGAERDLEAPPTNAGLDSSTTAWPSRAFRRSGIDRGMGLGGHRPLLEIASVADSAGYAAATAAVAVWIGSAGSLPHSAHDPS